VSAKDAFVFELSQAPSDLLLLARLINVLTYLLTSYLHGPWENILNFGGNPDHFKLGLGLCLTFYVI